MNDMITAEEAGKLLDGTTFHSGTIFTADDRPGWIADWVWKDHVLKLEVGKYLATDFHRIFRVV